MLQSRFLYALLITLYPVLFLYAENIDQVKFIDALIPTAIALACVSAMIAIFYLIGKNLTKSALLASACAFMFYSYGLFQSLINNLAGRQTFSNGSIAFAWGLIFVLAAIVIIKEKEPGDNLIGFLNVVTMALIIMPCYKIITFHAFPNRVEMKFEKTSMLSNQSTAPKPDIYHIILDGYGRNDVLQEIYGFDNRPFTDSLAQKGFYIAQKARANYCQTYLSLSSMLNFIYLDELKEKYSKINSVDPLIEMISKNRLFAFLKQQGYATVAFSSGYSGTELKQADHHIARDMIGREFLNVLLNTTYLSAFKLSFFDLLQTQIEIHRNRINEVFAGIPEVSKLESRPFIAFAHIVCPHPPFVFDETGNKVEFSGKFSLRDGSQWKNEAQNYKEYYVNQLKYINRKVKIMVEEILANDDRKKVIIIQADHGPGSELNWQNPEETNMKERLSILYAIYFDDSDYAALSPTFSPVNTYRLILNKYFGTDYEMLPNRSFFSKWFGRYQFIEVTDQL